MGKSMQAASVVVQVGNKAQLSLYHPHGTEKRGGGGGGGGD